MSMQITNQLSVSSGYDLQLQPVYGHVNCVNVFQNSRVVSAAKVQIKLIV